MQAAPVGSLPREQFVQVVRRVEQQTWGLSESIGRSPLKVPDRAK